MDIGGISGLVSPSIGNTVITPGQAADLLADLWYISIHTLSFPGGEIRGQVLRSDAAVPAPTSLALIVLGLMALRVRRKR